jgi:hypothetical protein
MSVLRRLKLGLKRVIDFLAAILLLIVGAPLFLDDVKTRTRKTRLDVPIAGDAEFDAILQRVKDAGLAFGSGPRSLEDGKLNDWNDGRGFYYKDHDGHVIELMTVPQ